MFGKADINYEPKNEIIMGTSQTPVVTAGVAVIDYHVSNDNANQYVNTKMVRGNSQASLRFTVGNMGSLTEIDFYIYWYSNLGGTDTAFQRTLSAESDGTEMISLNNVKVTATGSYDYDFPLMACDGIKIVCGGVGTATGSSVTNIHLALRTN